MGPSTRLTRRIIPNGIPPRRLKQRTPLSTLFANGSRVRRYSTPELVVGTPSDKLDPTPIKWRANAHMLQKMRRNTRQTWKIQAQSSASTDYTILLIMQ